MLASWRVPVRRTLLGSAWSERPRSRGSREDTEILAATFDRGARFADVDVGFVVGALTFVDRTDDAAAVFDAWRARAPAPDPRTLAAGNFFLGLAYARAGYFDRSFALLGHHLSGTTVFKVGEVTIDVYVVGRTADGQYAGVKTEVVET